MRQKKFWFAISGILAALAMALMTPAGAGSASKYKVLHSFKGSPDAANPRAGLILDATGNLYGTTYLGGTGGGGNGYGTVFMMAPNGDGTWTESVLHSFMGGDGSLSFAGLIFDAVGDLYGTTAYGGNGSWGVVFKLTPNSDGSWTESVLYSFTAGADGGLPSASLIFDGEGNLYGTTKMGGDLTCNAPSGCGTVFKLTPQSDGSWKESVLHRFTGGTDGGIPSASLIFDGAGNLYSTTVEGGDLSCSAPYGCGTVFKLTPQSDGSWKESVLHRFGGPDGLGPAASVIFDGAGNLYGTTQLGGDSTCVAPYGCGTVFKLTPQSDGSWKESVLHVFLGRPARHPLGGLVLDGASNLYGTANDCASGIRHCHGVVFETTP
jgi:uncharacterized repeat protein (TIGR03803 family)